LLTAKTNLATTANNHPYNDCFYHMLFEAWVARHSANSDLGRAQRSLGTADLQNGNVQLLGNRFTSWTLCGQI